MLDVPSTGAVLVTPSTGGATLLRDACGGKHRLRMTSETLRVSEPRDVLAMVPFQLGFVPTDSLVTISLRGPRRRVGMVGRVDLPPPQHRAELAVRLAHHLASDGAREAVVVVYSGHEDPLAAPEVAGVLDAMQDALDDAGILLLDAWHVGAARYRSLVCVDECCPVDGFPVEKLMSSVLAAEMTVRGAAFVETRQETLGSLTPAPGERLAQVERHAVRQQPPSAGRDRGRARSRWRRRVLGTWRAEVSRVGGPSRAAAGPARVDAEVDAEAAGRLLAGLDDLTVRDAVMLTCVPGCGTEPERFVATAHASSVTAGLFEAVFGTCGAVRPEPTAVQAASHVLSSLVRQASGRRAAPPLTLLAWLAWWSGNGGMARDYVDRALAADPGHRFADLLVQSLDRGVGPGWVQRDRLADEDANERTTRPPSAC